MNEKLLGGLIIAFVILSSSGFAYGQVQSTMVVDKANWFSLQSQQLAEPGMNYVPLLVNFIVESPAVVTNLNVSIDTLFPAYFQYSYIYGYNGSHRDYYLIPEATPGENLTIYQLINISYSAPTGFYRFQLNYSYSSSGINYTGNTSFDVPLLGYAKPLVAQAFFGTQNKTLYATSFMNNVPFTVLLENEGNSPAFNVTVRYSPTAPLFGRNQTIPVSAIPAYSVIPLTFMANIGASPMSIEQNLQVIYNDGSRINLAFNLTLAGYSYVKVAQAYINTNDISPSPGMEGVPLTVYLEDTSIVPVVNATVEFTPTYPLSGYTQEINVPAIPAYTPISLNFFVNITGYQGLANESLTVYYNGTWHQISFQVIISGKPSINLITFYTDPPWVYENEQFVELKAVFVNSGNGIAENLNITGTSKYFTLAQNYFTFPKVLPGQLVNLTFLFSTGNSSGIFPITLNTTFGTYILNIKVLETPSLNFTDSIPTIYPGSNKNLFVFHLTNTGNVAIYDINIHILTPDVFYIDIQSSNALGALTANNITFGSLNPGQTIIITFLIDVRSTTSLGDYPSQLFVSYRLNNSPYQFFKVFNFDVNVNYTGIQKITSGYYLPEIIIAIAAVLIVVFSTVIIRRRRRNKK